MEKPIKAAVRIGRTDTDFHDPVTYYHIGEGNIFKPGKLILATANHIHILDLFEEISFAPMNFEVEHLVKKRLLMYLGTDLVNLYFLQKNNKFIAIDYPHERID